MEDEKAVLGERAWCDERFARRVAAEFRRAVRGDERRILSRRIERRRKLQQAVERCFAVRGRIGEQLRFLQPQLGESRRVALCDLAERAAAPGVGEPCRRRHVVGLVDVDEVLAVRRDAARPGRAGNGLLRPRSKRRDAAADGVVKRRIGQPPIVFAVETHTMELQLQTVVAVARRIKDDAGSLVELHERRRLESRGRRQGCDQVAAEIVQVKVVRAVPLRLPDEALAVGEKEHARLGHEPAGRPLFAQDHAARAGHRVRRRDLHDVLAPVRAEKQQLASIRRPRHAVDVVADDRVVERFSPADVHALRLLRRHVVDVQIDERIR